MKYQNAKKSNLRSFLYGGRKAFRVFTLIMFIAEILSVVLMCVLYFTKLGVPYMTQELPEYSPAYVFSGGETEKIAEDADICLCNVKKGNERLLVLLDSDGMNKINDNEYLYPIYGRVHHLSADVLTLLEYRYGDEAAVFGNVYLDTTEIVYSPYMQSSLWISLALTFIVLILFIADAAYDRRLYHAFSALENTYADAYTQIEKELCSGYNIAIGNDIIITKKFYIDRKRGIAIYIPSIRELSLKEKRAGRKTKSSSLYASVPTDDKLLIIKGKCVRGTGIANAVEKLIKARM